MGVAERNGNAHIGVTAQLLNHRVRASLRTSLRLFVHEVKQIVAQVVDLINANNNADGFMRKLV